MTEEHGRGALLDKGTAVDDQGTHREVAVARADMVAMAGGGCSRSGAAVQVRKKGWQ